MVVCIFSAPPSPFIFRGTLLHQIIFSDAVGTVSERETQLGDLMGLASPRGFPASISAFSLRTAKPPQH